MLSTHFLHNAHPYTRRDPQLLASTLWNVKGGCLRVVWGLGRGEDTACPGLIFLWRGIKCLWSPQQFKGLESQIRGRPLKSPPAHLTGEKHSPAPLCPLGQGAQCLWLRAEPPTPSGSSLCRPGLWSLPHTPHLHRPHANWARAGAILWGVPGFLPSCLGMQGWEPGLEG